MTNREKIAISKLIRAGIREFPKVLARKEKAHQERKKHLKAFGSVSRALKKKSDLQAQKHPWRLCPPGKYFRNSHLQKPYVRANGESVRGSLHPSECVINPTGKDQIYAEELHEMARRHFSDLSELPNSGKLTEFKDEDKFDTFIGGWTQYWNEVLGPSDPLDPNLVKALIASESSFHPNPLGTKASNKLKARGLMQVTNSARKSLAGLDHELKDHFVHVDLEDISDPNFNIACGIRWLFRKNEIARSKNPNADWIDTVKQYKGYKTLDAPGMAIIMGFYRRQKGLK